MIANIIVLVFVLGLGYWWSTQGLFSGLIHFVCTIIAGAIAFAVWEPLVLGLIIERQEDIAWGVGLGVPFFLSLLIMRLLTDKIVPGNVDMPYMANSIGGGAFGALSGVITAGIVILCLLMTGGIAHDLKYQPLKISDTGLIEDNQTLWIPADKITAGLYATISLRGGAFNRQFPDLFQQIALFPVTSRPYARGAIRPDKFEIAPYFEITGDQVPEQINAGSQRLVVIDVNVTDATASSDTDGFFTLTGAQAPMFCEDANGKIATIFPTGWVYKSAVHEYVTLDSNKSFVYSRPGAGSTRFSLIYRVPDGSTPFMMRFKQLAMPLEMNKEMTAAEVVAMVDKTYWDPQAAEVAVEAHEKNQGNTGLKISDGTSPGARIEGAEIVVSNALPAGYNKNSIDADLSGVSYGDMGDDRSSLRSAQGPIDHTKNRSVRGALRVDKFFHERGTVIVQLKMTENQARSTLGQAMQAAARIAKPLLHDSNGDDFEAIGYVIHGSTYTFFSLDPEQPIRAISNIERDRMNEGDELILIFKVPNDSTLTRFTIGRAVDQEIR